MVPKELDIAGVYLPPTLVVGLMALAAAWATAWLLNRIRFTRFVVHPPLVFLAIIALYFSALGTFVFRI
jgi:hypothetical protein